MLESKETVRFQEMGYWTARIISISNRTGSGKEITADLHLLLYNGRECRVRVGTDRQGRHCSTTALTAPGFPMFTDQDDELIQHALSDN